MRLDLDHLGKRRLLGQLVDLSSLEGGSTPAEETSRRNAIAAIERCIQAAWEGSTCSRYDSILRGPVSRVESTSGLSLLPCNTDVKFMVLFSKFEGSPWNSVVTAKSAVRGWHVQRNRIGEWEAAWTERASLFWRGLKKRCDHTLSSAKRPLSITELTDFVRAAQARGSAAGTRNAASAAVCFFGIRRCSEMRALLCSDVRVGPAGVELHIRRQKNDPFGKGMNCFIPAIPQLGVCCPVRLLRDWQALRQSTWGGDPAACFFCVTGAFPAKATGDDTLRRALSAVCRDSTVGSHSLRKGGAHWWKTQGGVPEEVIQAQGGWSTPATMRAFYARFSDSERYDIMQAGVARCFASACPSLSLAERAVAP